MKEINQLDLFSGIGGFHLGFERAGYKVNSYFSEVDKHAIAVYQHQFKDSTYVGSVTDVRGADLPRIDLITFGSPCQDFSQAGSRRGLTGDRSSLIAEAIRLIGECRPRVFIWENVKGAFSSNDGADFAAILQAFVNIGGYRLEWQLLNTSWFLPQNRERVYLVGHLAEARGDWGGVFPIGRSGKQNIQLRREAYEVGDYRSDEGWRPRKDGNCPTLAARAREDGSGQPLLKVKSATSTGYDIATEGDAINLTAINSTTRRGRVGKQQAQTLDTLCEQAVVTPKIIGYSRDAKGKVVDRHIKDTAGTIHTGSGGGGNTDQFIKQPNYEIVKQKVWVRKHKVDIEGLQHLLRSSKNKSNKEIAEALNQPITKVEHWFRKNKAGFSIPEAELWNDLKSLLGITTTEYDAQVTEFVEQDGKYDQAERVYNTEGLAPTLTLAQEVKIKDKAVVQPNYTYKKVNETIEQNPNSFKEGEPKMMDLHNRSVKDESPCLVEPHHNNSALFNGYRIRRLTPIECERLQGFPDNHTSKGIYDGEVKEMSNTQRYKQCGNAVTVDVVQAIAERLHPMFEE